MLETIKQLLEQKDYIAIKKTISETNVVDIAALFDELEPSQQLVLFRLLPKSICADVFAYMPLDFQQEFIMRLTEAEARDILNDLFIDDAADLLEEMPASVVNKLLKHTDAKTRYQINHILKYPEDSAGSHMTVEFVDLKPTMTIREAIRRIRAIGIDSETINTCYVVDHERHLLGYVTIRQLILSQSDTLIENIMIENLIKVNTLQDQEAMALDFTKYDLTVMPVVDNEDRLVGIVTVDDVVDILQEEATEDMEMMSGMSPSDKPYLRTGVFETFKQRIPWLLLLMVSATFTGKIIQGFETALASCAVLTAFIPMLMDTGGNSGSQTSVSVIRGISLGEIEFKDTLQIMFKELRVSFLVGGTLAVCNFFKILIIDGVGPKIALVVCLTLWATVMIAKFVGAILPIGAKKIGFDPAIMASPFITTIVDALSLLIYFSIARSLLGI